MILIKVLFWSCLAIVVYTYVGYGIVITLLNRFLSPFSKKQEPGFTDEELPEVALIIAAYNEEDYIEHKISNTRQLDYPPGKLKVYIVTDGSTDKTPDLVARHSNIILLHQAERKGKAAAMNRAVLQVKESILVFCDANTDLNKTCIRELVKHYKNEKVGAVAGEKKIYQLQEGEKAATAGEGFYWKYESYLKKQDAIFYSVVGAAGELFSLRRHLYEALEPGLIIEDFVLSMRICQKGYVVQYSPNAFAMETGSASITDERKRKIRIAAGGFQSILLLKPLLNPFRYGRLSFQFISHRVLRWTITPLCLALLIPLNILLVVNNLGKIYTVSLAMQIGFYLAAITGWLLANKKLKIKVLYIPYYFLFMNISVFIGFHRFIRGKQTVLWDKAARQK
jgi:cellulose synthase/poly-beta-1,6-N-acetylglucosamine synthase-like glycosyltransferase